jgi:hypothetical protein
MLRGLSRKPFSFERCANAAELDVTTSPASPVRVTSPQNYTTHVLVNPGATVLWFKWAQDGSMMTTIAIPTAGSPQPAIPVQPGQSLTVTLAPNSYFETISS